MTPVPTPDPSLAETLHLLWPDSELEVVRGRRRHPAVGTELTAFPDLHRNRLLLPASARAAGAAVHRFSAAAGRAEVGARVAARTALRYGVASLLPDRIRLRGGSASIRDHLAEVLGRDHVEVSLSLGPARVNRKPVLQVFDAGGRSLGFAKVGTTPAAATVVTTEADALASLADRVFPTLRIPRVLGMHDWRGMPVLVLEDLGVRAAPLLRRGAPVPRAAMTELTDAFTATPEMLTRTGWWHACRGRAQQTPDGSLRDRLLTEMETLATRHRDPVPISAWHGDWTPWNTAPGRGTTLVWDWERFEAEAPTGLDAVHYAVSIAVTRHGPGSGALATAVRTSAPDALTGALYLVAVASRYLAMTGEEHGELVDARARETLEALTSVLIEGR